MLAQWWNCTGETPLRTTSKLKQLHDAIIAAADLAEGFDIEDGKVVVCEVLGHQVTMPLDPGCDESEYAKELLQLWIYEFYFEPESINSEFVLALEKQRGKCPKLSVCHRLAHAVFPDFLSGQLRRRFVPEDCAGMYMGTGEPTYGASCPSPWLPTPPGPLQRTRLSVLYTHTIFGT